MKNSIFILIFLLLALTINIYSQVTQQWVSRYNGTGNINDEAQSIALDSSGNVYVTGHSTGSWLDIIDFATIKYNPAGVQQWVQRYNGPASGADYASSIAVDFSGNIYVTGFSAGIGSFYDYATIKYNSSGDSVWVRRFNGPGNNYDIAYAITVDLSGNVYVTGRISAGEFFDDYGTIKYNSSGNTVWVRSYNGPGNNSDIAYAIAVDLSGNVYVTGWSAGSGTSYDYATIKYNSSGDSVWVRRYNGTDNNYDEAYAIAVDFSENVYVTGRSAGIGTSADYATIKYNSAGVQQWVQRYNGSASGSDEAHAIVVGLSGDVYVTGQSFGNGTSSDYATVKYNPAGVQQWVQRYNEPGGGVDAANSITMDGSGNIYITGESMNSETFVYDYATLKYDPSGTQKWVQRYNGPGNGQDRATSICLDKLGHIYVTGGSVGIGTSSDFVTIKYSQSIGIQPISNNIPNQFSLSQNYPNPFNPNTTIKFNIKESSLISLKVFDILGREAETLVYEQLNPGTYKIEWNASNYPSGVYYYKLSTGDPSSGSGQFFTDSKKMVLLK